MILSVIFIVGFVIVACVAAIIIFSLPSKTLGDIEAKVINRGTNKPEEKL